MNVQQGLTEHDILHRFRGEDKILSISDISFVRLAWNLLISINGPISRIKEMKMNKQNKIANRDIFIDAKYN